MKNLYRSINSVTLIVTVLTHHTRSSIFELWTWWWLFIYPKHVNFLLAQFVFPDYLKCWIDFNRWTYTNSYLITYVTLNRYSIQTKYQEVDRESSEFKYLAFCSLLQWPSSVASLLFLTWNRNMKKDSVSCIICNRQIYS